jgi:dGTPase
MVKDVFDETCSRLDNMNIKSPEDVRLARKTCVSFSNNMNKDLKLLRKFLFEKVYKNYKLNRLSYKVNHLIKGLFDAFMERPDTLPNKWQDKVKMLGGDKDKNMRSVVIKDYIAGMTDRFAINEYRELYNSQFDIS